jgi:SAM-dependent methyltransferase
MGLHPLVAGFSDVADDYELGRPGYPPEVVEVITARLELPPRARIADVGAGTGKLTRALVAAGHEVVAIEPLAGLRERLREAVPEADARGGAAEALPLAEAEVDAVVCANAFHWFDAPRAVAEFARVIRPGGGLALIWHDGVEDDESAPWSRELHAVIQGLRPEHPAYSDDQGRGAVTAHVAFGALTSTKVHSSYETDARRVLAHVASMSWVGGLAPEDRTAALHQAAQVLERHAVGTVSVPLRTTLWTAHRLGI